MCTFHHRALHEGIFSIRVNSKKQFDFYDSHGEQIQNTFYPQFPKDASAESSSVETENEEHGVNIDVNTAVTKWTGESCDYSMAIDGAVTAGWVFAAVFLLRVIIVGFTL